MAYASDDSFTYKMAALLTAAAAVGAKASYLVAVARDDATGRLRALVGGDGCSLPELPSADAHTPGQAREIAPAHSARAYQILTSRRGPARPSSSSPSSQTRTPPSAPCSSES